VIADPPFDAGALNEMAPEVDVVETELMVGAPGVVIGVTALVVLDHVPVPSEFTAATRNTYDVPLVKPVTVTAVLVEAARENVVQFAPPFVEY
jgi:hypothetical protein